jgi:hypothetical protein
MYLDVYIGQLEAPPRWWRKAKKSDGPPVRQSPFFPSGHTAFREVKRRIASGEYRGEQVDWGAWVARVSKSQLQALIHGMYDHDPTYGPKSTLPHIASQLTDLRSYVDGLQDGEYALVACEL